MTFKINIFLALHLVPTSYGKMLQTYMSYNTTDVGPSFGPSSDLLN